MRISTKIELTQLTKIELTELQVLTIVTEWYTNGMYKDILQDSKGNDLEEICNDRIDEINKMNN